ncbi:hypothetical protein AAKU67_003628 [Oxalobacteraceae bacterium GrIS 2.11]
MPFSYFFSKTAQVAPTPCRMYRLDSNHKRVKTSEPQYSARNPGADKNSQLAQAGKNKTVDPSSPSASDGSLRGRGIGLTMLLLGAAGIAAIIITGPVGAGVLGLIITYQLAMGCLMMMTVGCAAVIDPKATFR